MSRAVPRYRRDNAALPVPVEPVFKVELLMTMELQQLEMTFYYMTDGTALTDATERLIATALGTILSTIFQPAQTNDINYTGCRVSCMTDKTRQPYTDTSFTPLTGSNTGHALPSLDAVVFSRRTKFRTACGRGRFYLPGIPEEAVIGSFVNDNTYKSTLGNCASTLMTNVSVISVGVLTPCLFSKGSRTHKQAGAAVLKQIDYSTLIGTCRHRRVGRGK